MTPEEYDAVVATYAQLLANAQKQAITAQVQAGSLRTQLEAKEHELAQANETITELKNPPLPIDEPNE